MRWCASRMRWPSRSPSRPRSTERDGDLGPRGRDRRLAGGPRHRRRLGLSRRRSSRAASTPTGWSASPPPSTKWTRRRRWRRRSAGCSYTIDTELLMNQIAEASKRISALVADAKQYSQMDRAPYQVADVHDLLHSTLMMFADRLGKDKPCQSRWSRNAIDRSRRSLATQAISTRCGPTSSTTRSQAMGEPGGTLTIRTCREGDDMLRVEICDTGPGIPEDVRRAHLQAVLHHQSRSAKAPASGWTSPGGSSSRSTTAICGWSPCPATPDSSWCCRWRCRPRRRGTAGRRDVAAKVALP